MIGFSRTGGGGESVPTRCARRFYLSAIWISAIYISSHATVYLPRPISPFVLPPTFTRARRKDYNTFRRKNLLPVFSLFRSPAFTCVQFMRRADGNRSRGSCFIFAQYPYIHRLFAFFLDVTFAHPCFARLRVNT